jgi:hypothetical protein
MPIDSDETFLICQTQADGTAVMQYGVRKPPHLTVSPVYYP